MKKIDFKKIAIAVVIVLVAIIIVEVVLIFGGKKEKQPGKADATATLSSEPSVSSATTNTESPAQTEENIIQKPTETAAETAAETAVKTSAPTQTEKTEKPVSTYEPKPMSEDGAKIIDPASIDYSFLNGLSTGYFEDAGSDGNGGKSYDWYPGAVKRTADGKVEYQWDRYASTLKLLEKYGGIYRIGDQNNIYLTFDCGYEYGYTVKILDILKSNNVKAIFFVTGDFLDDDSNIPILKRMYAEGHLIGNHTHKHKVMPTVSNETFVEELNYVYKKCKSILGDDFKMAYYRPPQGACCERDLALANYLGYHTVFWSFAHGDYNVDNQPPLDTSLQKLKDTMHPGAVYLLHAISSTNTAILDDFIKYGKSEGFDFKRLDQK